MVSKIINYIIIGIGLSLITSISILYYNNKKLKENLSVATANVKAYASANSSLKNDNRVFQLTVDQLGYYNDSILEKLNTLRKELGIKDKELKSLQYMSSVITKTDTFKFRDTLFIDKALHIDTIIGDKWYNVSLRLKYPNMVITSPEFRSEKYAIISYKKETINPPKKCKLLRFFQKKHKVITAEVIEKNPYIEDKQVKFVEILP